MRTACGTFTTYLNRLVRGLVPISEMRKKWVCEKVILRVSHSFEATLKAASGGVSEEGNCRASSRAEAKPSTWSGSSRKPLPYVVSAPYSSTQAQAVSLQPRAFPHNDTVRTERSLSSDPSSERGSAHRSAQSFLIRTQQILYVFMSFSLFPVHFHCHFLRLLIPPSLPFTSIHRFTHLSYRTGP